MCYGLVNKAVTWLETSEDFCIVTGFFTTTGPPPIQRRMEFRSSFNTKKIYVIKRMHHFWMGAENICKNEEEEIFLQMKSVKGNGFLYQLHYA